MRYPNPKDENEVCCYGCSDYLTARIAVQECAGGAWFCPFCLVEDRQYRIDNGMTVAPLPIKARRFLAGHVKTMQAALKYPIGA